LRKETFVREFYLQYIKILRSFNRSLNFSITRIVHDVKFNLSNQLFKHQK